jgi:GT2 family glycosyltransferase
MTAVLAVVVGPTRHGVVRLARTVAHDVGHGWNAGSIRTLRIREVDDVLTGRSGDLPPAAIAHVHFTDGLFGPSCDVSATQFERLAGLLRRHGMTVLTTVHDVPHPEDDPERYARRSAAYARVVAASSGGVIVSSEHEALLLQGFLPGAAPTVIPLPIEAAAAVDPRPAPEPDVALVGFVYPGKGHAAALAALDGLAPDLGVLALGSISDGHDSLAAELRQRAADRGRRLRITGPLGDVELIERMRCAAVPLAAHEHISASGSINSWLTAGRRPLVPDCRYTRELDARCPGSVQLYSPSGAGLRAAIVAAQAQPEATWLTDQVVLRPARAEVAERHRAAYLGAAHPPTERTERRQPTDVDRNRSRIFALSDRQFVLPGNRWDLLDGYRPQDAPTVSVVIPYYQAQPELDRLLVALGRQRHPLDRVEVIVADDGSDRPPRLSPPPGLSVRLVRQADRGFRAAAARNLGARAATGDVLCFLDVDTVPEPDFVSELVRLPALAPDAVVVGRRRHAELTGWSPANVAAWLDGARTGPAELAEPAWLADEFRHSRDLLDLRDHSYRHVISAVLGCSRALFAELGGFDAGLIGYGGEDWDLAHRALCAGAVLAHVRSAVAWHDGPDWAVRGSDEARRRQKNAETAALAERIPHPTRLGPWTGRPNVVVELATTDEEPAAVIVAVRALLAAGLDCGIWLSGATAAAAGAHFAVDPRVSVGPVDPHAAAGARVRITVSRPLRFAPHTWSAVQQRWAEQGLDVLELRSPDGTARICSSRAAARSRRWQPGLPDVDLLNVLFRTETADAAHYGVTPVPRHPALSHELN